MAISEATKRAVARLKGDRKALHEKTKREIDEHQAAIRALKDQEKALDEELKALEKDIPDPTPEMPETRGGRGGGL